VAAGETACVPVVATVPVQAPDAVQTVALVELQESVALEPTTMLGGATPIETLGGGATTVNVKVAS
jgi:hypothetical protein